MDTKQKTAIVTGVCGGIGGAVRDKLLSEGYIVVGMDVRDTDAARQNYVYMKGDLSAKEAREALVALAAEQTGAIDVLVNVAGVAPRVRADLLTMTEESYDFVMDINTRGTFFLTQAVANHMIAHKNREDRYIVNISSCSAYTTSVNRGEYCISKAGVSMITKLFADRLAEYGILVNEIRPGIIRTGMTAAVEAKYDNLIAGGLLPVKRWGEPSDIAAGVYALCSGILPYVTGQSLDVDGGFHIKRL